VTPPPSTPGSHNDDHAVPIDWARFNTDAHKAAQAACVCLISCAVDGATRKAVVEHLDYVRRIGDIGVLPLLLARLTGPCCLPPMDEPTPTPDPGPPGSEEPR